jgi:hypothetical protein
MLKLRVTKPNRTNVKKTSFFARLFVLQMEGFYGEKVYSPREFCGNYVSYL